MKMFYDEALAQMSDKLPVTTRYSVLLNVEGITDEHRLFNNTSSRERTIKSKSRYNNSLI